MKKVLSVLLALALTVTLFGCKKTAKFSDEVLKDTEKVGYCLAGPEQNYVGSEENKLAWAPKDACMLTATSLAEVAKVDEALATKLQEKGVKALYMISGVELGKTAANYSKLAYKEDGSLVQADGALTFKIIGVTYDSETEKNVTDGWYPSAEIYGESLTPAALWYPAHSSVLDENGLDHNSDPVALAGAGTYTVVFAIYKAAVNGSLFGTALIQTKANAEGQQPTAVVPVAVTTMGVIGYQNWDADNQPLTKGADGAWTGTITVEAGQSFKVRANGAWDYSWGFADLTTANAAFVEADGNLKVVVPGTYKITIKVADSISIVKHSASVFTVEAVE